MINEQHLILVALLTYRSVIENNKQALSVQFKDIPGVLLKTNQLIEDYTAAGESATDPLPAIYF